MSADDGLCFSCGDCGWEIAAKAAAAVEYAVIRHCQQCGFRLRLHLRERPIAEAGRRPPAPNEEAL